MLNYWWVTRPKRKLNSIPEVLATFAEISLNQEWQGQRDTHLSLEDALEHSGLKRKGERRDQTGGGARTYTAWVKSLGLIFARESSKKIKLTLAGEAIMAGESPVEILKNQIIKYQFPSSFSLSRGVNVANRFKIRPFIFLFKLLHDNRIKYLTQEEVAKIICVEAENESDSNYEYIVNRLNQFRSEGDTCLCDDFFDIYKPSRGEVNPDHPYSHLIDIANTMVNWLDYTQLVYRDNGKVGILPEKYDEVEYILNNIPRFIDRPNEHEYFQRKYGLDPKHRKDTRNLTQTNTITAKIIAESMIRKAYIAESLRTPITEISVEIIEKVANRTGIKNEVVAQTLEKLYPYGSIGSFMTQYFEMAFKGRDDAINFELATVDLFEKVFGFESKHVGPIGKTPDVLILSDNDGYQAIIDNKAYSQYSISNDHHNRMIYNYIGEVTRYSDSQLPLSFFSYIAGGFGINIDNQLQSIVNETNINGSGISVSNMIAMIQKHQENGYSHKRIREIFSINRQINIMDFQ